MQPQITTTLYDYEGAVLLIIYSYRGGHVTSLVCPFVGWICLKNSTSSGARLGFEMIYFLELIQTRIIL